MDYAGRLVYFRQSFGMAVKVTSHSKLAILPLRFDT